MLIKGIEEANLEGQKVLARFDFNVPLSKSDQSILDTSRIDLALPTIKLILDKGAKKLILMSHLGRPKGQIDKKYSLEPVAKYLAEALNEEVLLTESCVDSGVKELLTLNKPKVILLENLRFHLGETENNEEFAAKLASYGDIYVNDAFGAAHREHASVHIINKFFEKKAYAGLLIQGEIQALDKVLNNPQKPFIAIIGGAKVSDKIHTIKKLIVNVNHLIIGGAMAYPFLKAKGFTIGKSLCSEEDVKLAQDILRQDKGNKIILPIDHICAKDPEKEASQSDNQNIEYDLMGLDIGAKTLELYKSKLASAKTILWNGPMGLFENDKFSKGTMKLAEFISTVDSFTLVGGGDSVSAVKKSGFSDKFSHISTGGGASLEYIEKGKLPGINALKYGV